MPAAKIAPKAPSANQQQPEPQLVLNQQKSVFKPMGR